MHISPHGDARPCGRHPAREALLECHSLQPTACADEALQPHPDWALTGSDLACAHSNDFLGLSSLAGSFEPLLVGKDSMTACQHLIPTTTPNHQQCAKG